MLTFLLLLEGHIFVIYTFKVEKKLKKFKTA